MIPALRGSRLESQISGYFITGTLPAWWRRRARVSWENIITCGSRKGGRRSQGHSSRLTKCSAVLNMRSNSLLLPSFLYLSLAGERFLYITPYTLFAALISLSESLSMTVGLTMTDWWRRRVWCVVGQEEREKWRERRRDLCSE